MDRGCVHPALGEIDEQAGEFWIGNPFLMPSAGANLSAFERNRVYINIAGQSFLDASFTSAVDIDSDSRSVVAADFNRDGSPDLLVGSVGGGPLRLFLNRMPQGNRVRVHLRGTKSNRAAIGARVTALADGRPIVRDLFPANGCMGAGPVWLSLGGGSAESFERIEVRWPSGLVQHFDGVPATGSISIREGDAEFQHSANAYSGSPSGVSSR